MNDSPKCIHNGKCLDPRSGIHCEEWENSNENMNELYDACLGIPGCNHPQGEKCDCPCHKSEPQDMKAYLKYFLIHSTNLTTLKSEKVIDTAFQAGVSSTIAKIREEMSRLSWGPYDPISILDEVENEKN